MDLRDPVWIGGASTADRYEVEFIALHPFDQGVQSQHRRRRCSHEGTGKISVEANGPYTDRRRSGHLLRPPREVETLLAIDFRKLRLPESPLRAMKEVYTGFDERLQPVFELRRSFSERGR